MFSEKIGSANLYFYWAQSLDLINIISVQVLEAMKVASKTLQRSQHTSLVAGFYLQPCLVVIWWHAFWLCLVRMDWVWSGSFSQCTDLVITSTQIFPIWPNKTQSKSTNHLCPHCKFPTTCRNKKKAHSHTRCHWKKQTNCTHFSMHDSVPSGYLDN